MSRRFVVVYGTLAANETAEIGSSAGSYYRKTKVQAQRLRYRSVFGLTAESYLSHAFKGKDVAEWLMHELQLDHSDAVCIGRELQTENFITPVDPATANSEFRGDSSLYYVRYVRAVESDELPL